MKNIIWKFSFILLINMLAFLSIWHILDVILDTKVKYKIIFLVLSIISLIFLSKKIFNKTIKEMREITLKKNNNK